MDVAIKRLAQRARDRTRRKKKAQKHKSRAAALVRHAAHDYTPRQAAGVTVWGADKGDGARPYLVRHAAHDSKGNTTGFGREAHGHL